MMYTPLKWLGLWKAAFYALAAVGAGPDVAGQAAEKVEGSGAQDWPHWRGPGRDGRARGFVTPKSWPVTLEQKWKTTVGTGDATPALAGERLFAFARQGGNEVVLCLDAKDGRELWRNQYAAQKVNGPAAAYQGPRSSPVVAEGKVVTLGVGGVLSCVDAANGKLVWRNYDYTNTLPMFFTAMSPLVTEGICIAHLGGKDKGVLLAVDLANGTEKWKWTGDGPAYSSPSLMLAGGRKHIVLQTESHLLGLTLTEGKPLWKVRTPPESGYWNSSTPVVDGVTVIYSGQGTGTRAVRIVEEGSGFAAQELWHNPKLGTVYNTPVIKDGLLYGLSDRGRFFCLKVDTGETVWTSTNRVSNFGAIVDAGPALVALPEKSGLIFFKPSEQGYEELARSKVSEKAIYAHPVLAGRRIYVRDAETVSLWEQRK